MTKFIRNRPRTFFHYEDEACLRDQFGGIITVREYYELLDKVEYFYENVNDDDIEKYNQELKDELFKDLNTDSEH